MAREHARILTNIWDSSSDFRNLDADTQRVFFMLLSQRSLNHAGVLPLTVKKWANNAADTTAEDIWKELKVLDEARYVVLDEETEEVLIRTFIRNDGVARQPNVLKAALRLAAGVDSKRLRAALAGELRMVGSDAANRVADQLVGNPSGIVSATPVEPIANPSVNPGLPVDNYPIRTLPEPFARDAGEGEGDGEGVTSPSGQVLKKGNRPSERCPKHINDENPPACRGCRDARVAAETFDAEQTRTQRGQQSHCRMCDGDGWRYQPGGAAHGLTNERCDHIPRNQVTAS